MTDYGYGLGALGYAPTGERTVPVTWSPTPAERYSLATGSTAPTWDALSAWGAWAWDSVADTVGKGIGLITGFNVGVTDWIISKTPGGDIVLAARDRVEDAIRGALGLEVPVRDTPRDPAPRPEAPPLDDLLRGVGVVALMVVAVVATVAVVRVL